MPLPCFRSVTSGARIAGIEGDMKIEHLIEQLSREIPLAVGERETRAIDASLHYGLDALRAALDAERNGDDQSYYQCMERAFSVAREWNHSSPLAGQVLVLYGEAERRHVTSSRDSPGHDEDTVRTGNDKALARGISVSASVASLASTAVSVAALMTIPWQTTLAHTRVSHEWRVPLLFVGLPTMLLAAFWWRSRRDRVTGIVPKERIAALMGTIVFICLLLGSQLYLVGQFAEAAASVPAS